ncbi:MAG: phasin family protein [Pseudomonadota bacterium]
MSTKFGQDLYSVMDGRMITALSHANQEAMEGLTELGDTFFGSLVQANQEILRFATERAVEDFGLAFKLSQCGNLGEALDLQRNHVADTIRHYGECADKLAKIGEMAFRRDLGSLSSHFEAIKEEVEEVSEEIEREVEKPKPKPRRRQPAKA